MPEEQNQAPAESGQANGPAAAPAQNKKSNKGCVVAVVIVLIIVILAAVGIYLGYRYVKNKVKVSNDSSSVTIGDTTVNTSTSGDTYSTVTEQTITQDLAKQINSTIKPILDKIFGGTKIKAWSSFDNDSGSIGYVTKDKVTNDLITQIEPDLKSAGFSSTLSSIDQDGAAVSGILGDNTIYIYLDSSDNVNDITVAFSKNSTTSNTSDSSGESE